MRTEPTTFPLVARTTLTAVSTAPGAARSFVRDILRAWGLGPLIEDAEVITSELVTNAVKATGGGTGSGNRLSDPAPVGIELHLDEDAFRIAVRDSSSGRPALQTVGDDAENGRGLLLVQMLSTRWDVFFVAGGKVTWAELDTRTLRGA